MLLPPKKSKTILEGKRDKLNGRFRLKPVLIFFVGAFFAFAPAWAPHIQQIWGRNLFATPDPLVLFGITLLVALLGSYLFPDFFVSDRAGASSFCRSRTKALGFGIGLLSLIGLVFVLHQINQKVLHSFLSSADEHSCYFLAECLRRGKLYVDIPPLADFFRVVHVGMRDGKWFSVYPPGWPLIWAFGLQFNVVDWLNPVLSSLSVFFFYLVGKKIFGRAATLLGLAFMVLNPFFMFTAASYFSHATCLFCIGVFLYAFLRWREDYALGKDPVGWAFLCAFAVGYGLMTRYLTMAAIAGPFLLYHYIPIFFGWKRWGEGNSWLRFLPFKFKRPQLRKSDWIAVSIIAAFMMLILYQNYLVTGKAFRAPNKYDKSWERLGFRANYTPIDAFFYLIARVFYLMDWFAPAIVAAYLFLLGAGSFFKKKNLSLSENTLMPQKGQSLKSGTIPNLFRLSMFFVAFAYFFYYSWGGNQWGPRYFWEGMPFLCIAVADWIVCRWGNGSPRVRKFLLAFAVMSLVTSGMILARQVEYVEESSRQRRALYDLSEQMIRKPALVFIHGFLGSRLVFSEEDATRNSPFLDSKILYVHDLGDRNKELMVAYPEREYFRGTYNSSRKQPQLERIKA